MCSRWDTVRRITCGFEYVEYVEYFRRIYVEYFHIDDVEATEIACINLFTIKESMSPSVRICLSEEVRVRSGQDNFCNELMKNIDKTQP